MAWKPFQSQICIDFEHSSIQLEELWQQQQVKAAQGMMKLGGGTEPMGENKQTNIPTSCSSLHRPSVTLDELEAGSGQSWSLNQSRQPSFGL